MTLLLPGSVTALRENTQVDSSDTRRFRVVSPELIFVAGFGRVWRRVRVRVARPPGGGQVPAAHADQRPRAHSSGAVRGAGPRDSTDLQIPLGPPGAACSAVTFAVTCMPIWCTSPLPRMFAIQPALKEHAMSSQVQVHGACLGDASSACLIMELMASGNLAERIYNPHKRRMSYLEILQVALNGRKLMYVLVGHEDTEVCATG